MIRAANPQRIIARTAESDMRPHAAQVPAATSGGLLRATESIVAERIDRVGLNGEARSGWSSAASFETDNSLLIANALTALRAVHRCRKSRALFVGPFCMALLPLGPRCRRKRPWPTFSASRRVAPPPRTPNCATKVAGARRPFLARAPGAGRARKQRRRTRGNDRARRIRAPRRHCARTRDAAKLARPAADAG